MESPIKAGAVQMEARVGDIAGNLEKAERLLDEAASKGARLIILPEFFPSAAAFDPTGSYLFVALVAGSRCNASSIRSVGVGSPHCSSRRRC